MPDERFSLTVCPWTALPGRGAGEPMVGELNDGSLSCALRSTLGKVFKSISRDEGVTWTSFKDGENRAGFDNGCPAVTFLDDEALITHYRASRSMARDCWLELKIYPIAWLYEERRERGGEERDAP